MPATEPRRDRVAILDADASLAEAVAPATLASPLPLCVAGVRRLDPGAWQPPDDLAGSGGLGLLVLAASSRATSTSSGARPRRP